MFKTLKTNPTEFEKHLEKINAELRHYGPDYTALADPQRCPESFLPFLAWALSVDYWQESWPEQVKREVCIQSIQVHRSKGTLTAIKRALKAVNVTASIKEAKDHNYLAPHEFELFAQVDERLINRDTPFFSNTTYALLHAIIEQVKPVRSYYSFYVGAIFPMQVAFGRVFSGCCFKQQTVNCKPNTTILDASIALAQHSMALCQLTMETA